MEKKVWDNPEICQLGINYTEANTFHSENIDKEWIGPDNVKYRSYS